MDVVDQHKSRSKWIWLLAGCGLALIAVAFFARRAIIDSRSPGKLVSLETMKTWRSPSDDRAISATMEDTKTIFDVQNVGGKPVRILGVTSSCGCATPKIEPTTIPPGGIGKVEVRAIPLPTGESTATVTLKTDSLITPELHLQLRTIGSRRPPYLLKAVGDTSYRITKTSDLTRDITVYQVERKGTNAGPPIVTTTVPFLRFGDPKMVEEKTYVDENAVIRTYIIKATCSRDPKEDFSGDLIVTEPWNRERTISLPVHGEVIPPLRAIPSRVQLSGERRLSPGKDTFHVLIELSEGGSGLTAEIIGGGAAPFSLAPIQAGETRGRHMLALRLNEGDFRDGEWIVRVTHAATSTSLDIPVAFRTEAKP